MKKKKVQEIVEKLYVLRTCEEIDAVIEYLDSFEFAAYDTETTGLEQDAEIIGFSIACEVDCGFYILTSEWDKEKQQLIRYATGEYLEKVKELLRKLTTKKLVMHNATVDVNWTRRNFGIDLMPALHTDTMILAHLLDEESLVGLKELGYRIFGEGAKKEQEEMMASVLANGGIWEKKRGGNKEMYKADAEIIGRYGAKDTILTLKLFYHFIPQLFEQGLDKFFYDDESMPLFRGPTYDLNTTGLKIDMEKLKKLEQDLELECVTLRAEIMEIITPWIKDKYPGTKKNNTFNLNAGQQLSWLLFIKLNNDWKKLTKKGREFAKEHMGKVPYNPSGKREFMRICNELGVPPQKYIQCDKNALMNYAVKYKWVEKLLQLKAADKLLGTYARGMQRFIRYGVIYPSFRQTGTTGGRYSSSNPNFQNLPRKDKRIKSCVISRPGKSFVGADYEQLEPRVFASQSQDPELMGCFAKKEDFYSVIGMPVFRKYDCHKKKGDDPKFFGNKYPVLRDISKGVALSATYGTTAFKMADLLRDDEGKNLSPKQTQQIIDDYFKSFPMVKKLQLESHVMAMKDGVVYNLFGRPRRIPAAKKIPKMFPGAEHHELPYVWRSLLNLSINHRIQSTAASIMNRAAIAFYEKCRALEAEDSAWAEVKIVMQIHDELIVEAPDHLAEQVRVVLKDAMENTVTLPGVALVAEPKIAKCLADLK
jgi:DNA polymerase-1